MAGIRDTNVCVLSGGVNQFTGARLQDLVDFLGLTFALARGEHAI
jgi:hypothetical protein